MTTRASGWRQPSRGSHRIRRVPPARGSRAPGSAPPGVLARDPVLGEHRREAVEVLHGDVKRGDSHGTEADRITEVDAHAASRRAAEGHVTVPDADADADRRDPEPRAFDPP